MASDPKYFQFLNRFLSVFFWPLYLKNVEVPTIPTQLKTVPKKKQRVSERKKQLADNAAQISKVRDLQKSLISGDRKSVV